MRPPPRILPALLAAAACAAGQPAQAQGMSLGALPALLETQASGQLAKYPPGEMTFVRVVTFTGRDFRLTAPPPLRFEPFGDYLFYAARCTGGGPTPGADEAQQQIDAARQAMAGQAPTAPVAQGPAPPQVQSSAMPSSFGFPGRTGRNLMDVLPRPPRAPGDFNLTLEIAKTLDGVSYAPPVRAPADTLAMAWGMAATDGRARLNAPPILPSQPPPMLDDGMLVLAVTPVYDLKDASYTVAAGLGAFTARNKAGQESLVPAEASGAFPIRGLLSGGRWPQGSGLLFIPAPRAIDATGGCAGGAMVTRPRPELLARYGVQLGRPIEAAPPGAVFMRTAAFAP